MRRRLATTILAGLLVSGCSILPDFCKPEVINGKTEAVCRPKVHQIEVDCWTGGGGEIRLVGDGETYHRVRVSAGDPLSGLGKCPDAP